MTGIHVKDLFVNKGSSLRVKELQTLFNSHPENGIDFDWSGYTVHDAAAVMLLFLRGLPEPVVPHADSETFRNPLCTYISAKTTANWQGKPDRPLSLIEHEMTLFVHKRRIQQLYPSARHLLLFLLDILGILSSKSAVNGLTSDRLAATFQPMILASPMAVDGEKDYENVYKLRLTRYAVQFLIENQRSFVLREDSNISVSFYKGSWS